MHGDMTFDAIALTGSYGCVCGEVISFSLAQLANRHLSSDPGNPSNREALSIGVPPCGKCGSESFLACNLPADHPHHSAKVIAAIRALLPPPRAHKGAANA